jgi:Uma2 family endonuclease
MGPVTTITTGTQVHYPESDGKPMAETDVHISTLIYLREALQEYFRDDPQVYVAGNLLLYYEEGNPAACVAPDVFVVRGVPKGNRRIYKLWEEGHPPAVVIEITSRRSRLEDQGTKRALYAMLGVEEYVLYDPLHEYLQPPLQGYGLQQGEYHRLQSDPAGTLASRVLGIELRLDEQQLRLVDPVTGVPLLTPAEAHAARREAEARAAQEAANRREAEARAAQAEAELERLRAELTRLRQERA